MSAELYSQIRQKAVEDERGVTVERGSEKRMELGSELEIGGRVLLYRCNGRKKWVRKQNQ